MTLHKTCIIQTWFTAIVVAGSTTVPSLDLILMRTAAVDLKVLFQDVGTRVLKAKQKCWKDAAKQSVPHLPSVSTTQAQAGVHHFAACSLLSCKVVHEIIANRKSAARSIITTIDVKLGRVPLHNPEVYERCALQRLPAQRIAFHAGGCGLSSGGFEACPWFVAYSYNFGS